MDGKINELIEIIEFLVEGDQGLSVQHREWILKDLHGLKECD